MSESTQDPETAHASAATGALLLTRIRLGRELLSRSAGRSNRPEGMSERAGRSQRLAASGL